MSNLRKVDVESDLAIAALHLQQASYHLGCLTGNITTEDVLDVIFKDFCIGKWFIDNILHMYTYSILSHWINSYWYVTNKLNHRLA